MLNQKLNTLLFLLTFCFAPFAAACERASIVNIEDDQAIRANDGNVTIKIEGTFPYLVVLNGIIIDGATHNGIHVLENLDRGTHTIAVSSCGVQEEITFHVLRVHR